MARADVDIEAPPAGGAGSRRAHEEHVKVDPGYAQAWYELGRVCADPATGLLAAVVCGTTLMFLRFGRTATIDVHLALWVTVANVAPTLQVAAAGRLFTEPEARWGSTSGSTRS